MAPCWNIFWLLTPTVIVSGSNPACKHRLIDWVNQPQLSSVIIYANHKHLYVATMVALTKILSSSIGIFKILLLMFSRWFDKLSDVRSLSRYMFPAKGHMPVVDPKDRPRWWEVAKRHILIKSHTLACGRHAPSSKIY